MKLTIQYQDKSARVINLHPLFFHSSEVSWSKRANDIARDTGTPWKVQVMHNGDILVDQRMMQNYPEKTQCEKRVDERQIKKQLRREHKGDTFSMSHRYQF